MATYYLATNGDDGNAGTSITLPWGSWNYALNSLSPGDWLWVRGGTYTTLLGGTDNKYGVRLDTISGTSGSHITVAAYNFEVPILDCADNQSVTGQNVGIGIYGLEYWDFIGLSITNSVQWDENLFAAPGWYISDCSHMWFTRCNTYHCGDGFQVVDTQDDIHFINCDAYENADLYLDNGDSAYIGGLANGFYCNPSGTETIYYVGCRAWNNSDDGWDTFNSGSGYIYWENCWAFGNGYCPAVGYLNETFGDGAGFKLGRITGALQGTDIQRSLINCMAVENTENGFDYNSDPADSHVYMELYHCLSATNGVQGYQFYNDIGRVIIRNCTSYDETVGESDLIHGNVVYDHNSWDVATVTSADFKSVDTTLLKASREADGSLPRNNLFLLESDSDLVGAGVAVTGVNYDTLGNSWASPPSIGPYEYGTTIPVTAVTVTGAGNATTITVNDGTLACSAHIDPHDATNQSVTWTITNVTGTATVNSSGVVTALTNGTVRVRATANG